MKANFTALQHPVTRMSINMTTVDADFINYWKRVVTIDEANTLTIYFATKEEAEDIAKLFPKAMYRLCRCHLQAGHVEHGLHFNIDVVHTTKTTGDRNETAEKRRSRVLAILMENGFLVA